MRHAFAFAVLLFASQPVWAVEPDAWDVRVDSGDTGGLAAEIQAALPTLTVAESAPALRYALRATRSGTPDEKRIAAEIVVAMARRFPPASLAAGDDAAARGRIALHLYGGTGTADYLRQAVRLAEVVRRRPGSRCATARFAAEGYLGAVGFDEGDLQKIRESSAVCAPLLAATLAPEDRAESFPVYPFAPVQSAVEYSTEGRMDRDDNGVVVVDYGVASDLGAVGRRYNPTFIATYALMLYRDSVSYDGKWQRQSVQAAMLRNVEWLLANHEQAVYDGIPFWRWKFDFDYPYFGASAPWYSGLAQSRIVVALAQAYSLTGDARFRRAAEYAFRAFLVPMQHGGVTTFDGPVAWFEEIAGPRVSSSKILNGHLSAIAALDQYADWTGRGDVIQLASMGIAAVRRDLPFYDASFLSWYAQEGGEERKFAPTSNYNQMHVRQLAWLYDRTHDPFFLEYALRFGRYEDPGGTLSAAGSTDPVHHGPQGMRFRMGQEYWSHNQFPTWVQLDFGTPRPIRSVVALARTEKSAPRHYEVLVSDDGTTWERILERQHNVEDRIVEKLATPKTTRYVRLLIHSDNGNRNVALTGFTAVADGVPTVVADWHFSSGSLPSAGALTREWCIAGPEYLVVDLGEPRGLRVEMPDGGVAGLEASGSNDLVNFAALAHSPAGPGRTVIANKRYRYLRIDFADVPGERAIRLEPL